MLEREFYLNDANFVARNLLGKILVHNSPLGIISGVIVEAESYMGAVDPASHSYKNIRSKRTEIQFSEGGFAYVYLIYGMYYCFNVVTNVKDTPEAVLIRALEPLEGIDLMIKNRALENLLNLCSGPGKLCAALGINKSHYGCDLCGDILFIEENKSFKIADNDIGLSPRINIEYAGDAKDYLWRYFIKDNKFVSKYPTFKCSENKKVKK